MKFQIIVLCRHLIFILLLLPIFARGHAQPRGVITMIPQIQGGAGIYHDPYIIYTNIVEWRLDETYGSGKEQATYSTEIHMARHRSCAITVKYDNLSWSDIKGRIFRWKGIAGTYYISISAFYNGQESETRTYVHCQVPPVKAYSLPYSPPSNNQPSEPKVTIVNAGRGSGTYGDPIRIRNSVVRFIIDNTSDPDGHEDLVYGICYWSIYTDGHHPVYSSKVQHEKDPAKTYLYYDEFKDTVFEWDTRDRPSQDNHYRLVLCVMDQWGEWVESTIHFTHDPGTSSPSAYLMVYPNFMQFGANATNQPVTIQNVGNGTLNWNSRVTHGQAWISAITPTSGSVASGEKVTISVAINRAAVTANDSNGQILFDSNGGQEKIDVILADDTTAPQPPKHLQVNIP